MKINTKKNRLSYIKFSFIMLLFVMCLTVNALFFSTYSLYESSEQATVTETRAFSERSVVNGDGDNPAYNETITKNICITPIIAAIPEGLSLLLFLVIIFLFFFLTLFILLPDGWTLINQKVRLDN